MHTRQLTTLLLLIVTLAGCAVDEPMNPSFAVTVDEARQRLRAMEQSPVRLGRPVVVLSGWMDPGIATWELVPRLKRYTGDDRFLSVSFAFAGSFEQCRQRLIEAVDEAYPSDDPTWTREVDVVAYSMGGLVARYAALSAERRATIVNDATDASSLDKRRLRIARLFTISTPHRGAQMAGWAPWDRLARQMHDESTFIAQLEAGRRERERAYTLYPYTRLDDLIVGSANAAPAGRHPWWVPNFMFSGAHTSAHKDPRILADIAARLRHEPAYAQRPAAPLPGEKETEVSDQRSAVGD